MTLEECVALLTPLALAMQKAIDGPTFRAYHRLLKDVPASLADQALTDLSDGGLRFFPTAPDIQTAAEKVRRRLLALHPYDGCIECEGHKGMREIRSAAGQLTVQPCPCKARWQARLASMGALAPLALLPGEASVENEQVYPTVEQLPAAIRQQIGQLAAQKVLK